MYTDISKQGEVKTPICIRKHTTEWPRNDGARKSSIEVEESLMKNRIIISCQNISHK